MTLSLHRVVEALGGELHGDGSMVVERIATLEKAGPSDLAFLANPKYRSQLATTRAGCVLVAPDAREAAIARGGACIVTDDPYLYFAKLTQLWRRESPLRLEAGVHPSAVIDPSAVVDPSASIGPLCVVEAHARVGAATVLHARVHVGRGCSIGAGGIVHPGVVIGADGFGFAPSREEGWVKIEQLGAVRIGDDVEIGANTCIDRGALDDTLIEDGVKLDNLIQIGHNVRIGARTVIAGCVAIAGSARIGANCMIGGAAMFVGHIEIADGTTVSAGTFVSRSILKPGRYTGVFPMDDNAAWEKNAATIRQLHQLRDRVRALEKSRDSTP